MTYGICHNALKAVLFFGACILPAAAQSAVFVCSNDVCSAWTPITALQLASQSTDGHHTTIQNALANSTQDSVTNGYNSIANTNIYLKRSLWHQGGVTPFQGTDHVTAYVYKTTNLNVRLKTCHVFSISQVLGGPRFATCA